MDAAYTGKQIAERRKSLGMTQKDLAEKLHVTDKAVSKWERGINFPDLGLMESLAQVLGTTPACLLGLETANRDEVVSSITRISNEQLEDAHRDMKWIGWGSVVVAVLLMLVYRFIAYQRTQAYQLLYCLIPVIAVGGIHLLFKYGEIRKWNTMDWVAAYCAAIPVIIANGAYLFLDYGLHDAIELVLTLISVGAVQLLFYRIMRPRVMKACPVFFATAFALWHALDGELPLEYALPAVCCFVVWSICRIKKPPSK